MKAICLLYIVIYVVLLASIATNASQQPSSCKTLLFSVWSYPPPSRGFKVDSLHFSPTIATAGELPS